MTKEEYLRLVAEDKSSFPAPTGVRPEPDWVAEAWQQPEVREVFFAELARDLSKTGERPDGPDLLPVLNRSLPREALQEVYTTLRSHRYRPEWEWRDQFAQLVPNACPLPPTLEEMWEQARSPKELLQLIPEDHFSERKRRLFLVACFRRIEDLLTNPLSQEALALAERHAEGEAAREDLDRVASATWEAFGVGDCTLEEFLMEALHCLLVDGVPHVVPQAEQLAEFFSCRPTSQTPRGLPEEERRARWREVVRAEAQEQARLFRDIVGNPFHYDPVPLERDLLLDPALLAWQGGRLEQLAEEIYRARHFERLPELAALLEAAGCSDAELVRHCRQPAGHVRGCWVVDLLLNKQ